MAEKITALNIQSTGRDTWGYINVWAGWRMVGGREYSVACRNFHRFVALTIPYDPSARISLTLRTSCANQGARWREISSMEINFAVAGARDRVRRVSLCARRHRKLSNEHLSRTAVWTRTIENNCRDVDSPWQDKRLSWILSSLFHHFLPGFFLPFLAPSLFISLRWDLIDANCGHHHAGLSNLLANQWRIDSRLILVAAFATNYFNQRNLFEFNFNSCSFLFKRIISERNF